MFKTPTSRNVATRTVFFHNGRFHSLKEALRFYVRRNTDPKLWYAFSLSGAANKFDDLPAHLRCSVDVVDEPMSRRAAYRRRFSGMDRRGVRRWDAFLESLTDRVLVRQDR